MSEARFYAWWIGMTLAMPALIWTGAWVFDAWKLPPELVYSVDALAVFYWLGYFGWRA